MELKVYKCGTLARPKLLDVTGMITAVRIENDNITYELSYFVNAEHRKTYFEESELLFRMQSKVKIGFIK